MRRPCSLRASSARSAGECPRGACAAAAASRRPPASCARSAASNLPSAARLPSASLLVHDERHVLLVELGQQERESLLLDLRVLADLRAIQRAFARLLDQRKRVGREPRAVGERRPRARRAWQARAPRCRGRCRARRRSAPAGDSPARCSSARSVSRMAVLPPSAASEMRRGSCAAALLSARAIVDSSFCRPIGFSRKSKAPILVASTAVSIVP